MFGFRFQLRITGLKCVDHSTATFSAVTSQPSLVSYILLWSCFHDARLHCVEKRTTDRLDLEVTSHGLIQMLPPNLPGSGGEHLNSSASMAAVSAGKRPELLRNASVERYR
jgi:hypothetical protein